MNKELKEQFRKEVEKLVQEDIFIKGVIAGLVAIKLLNDKYDEQTSYVSVVSDLIDLGINQLDDESSTSLDYVYKKVIDVVEDQESISHKEPIFTVHANTPLTIVEALEKVIHKPKTDESSNISVGKDYTQSAINKMTTGQL